MTEETLTRRERVRRQTLAEIKQHALDQVADGGVGAISLNAIARAMGMSGPAIYRYYASRDELLGELVTDAYAELTRTLEEAASAAARRTPARRLAAVVEAYRGWALAHPRRYAMLFGERPAEFSDPQEAIEAVHGSMLVLLRQLDEIARAGAGAARPAAPRAGRLDTQLVRWAHSRPGDLGASPAVLRLGVLTWTRLHGIVTLELAGVFASMGIDAGLLLDAEVAQIVEAATA
jgi:AcrR family transcriptional regulator